MHKQLGKGFTHLFIEDARPDKFAAVRGNSPIGTRYEREIIGICVHHSRIVADNQITANISGNPNSGTFKPEVSAHSAHRTSYQATGTKVCPTGL